MCGLQATGALKTLVPSHDRFRGLKDPDQFWVRPAEMSAGLKDLRDPGLGRVKALKAPDPREEVHPLCSFFSRALKTPAEP